MPWFRGMYYEPIWSSFQREIWLILEIINLTSHSYIFQIDHGELENDKSGAGSKELLILQALDRFYPYKYRDSLTQEELT